MRLMTRARAETLATYYQRQDKARTYQPMATAYHVRGLGKQAWTIAVYDVIPPSPVNPLFFSHYVDEREV